MKGFSFPTTTTAKGLIVVAILCLGALLLAPACAETPDTDVSLSMDKLEFAPGESITVNFVAPPGLPEDAWIGIIPSDIPHGEESVNDQHDISYQYLDGKTSGTMTFSAPTAPGAYDFRMHDTDSGGVELNYITFSVVSPGGSEGEASLSLSNTVFAPGESIIVSFTAPEGLPTSAWIGVIPSDVPHGDESVNDQHDISYQYLDGMTSGALTFTAPDTIGSYDFRMNDNDSDGMELISITFMVQ